MGANWKWLKVLMKIFPLKLVNFVISCTVEHGCYLIFWMSLGLVCVLFCCIISFVCHFEIDGNAWLLYWFTLASALFRPPALSLSSNSTALAFSLTISRCFPNTWKMHAKRIMISLSKLLLHLSLSHTNKNDWIFFLY